MSIALRAQVQCYIEASKRFRRRHFDRLVSPTKVIADPLSCYLTARDDRTVWLIFLHYEPPPALAQC
jgi:hypothetical protein